MSVLDVREKDPDATVDFVVDWFDYLAGLDDDTITAAAFTVPAGLTKVSEDHTGTNATVWLSGGTAGQRYTVTCRVTTAGGRTDDWSFVVHCKHQ